MRQLRLVALRVESSAGESESFGLMLCRNDHLVGGRRRWLQGSSASSLTPVWVFFECGL